MQENWFGVLAYLLTYVTMIGRIVELEGGKNDIFVFVPYFCALIL